MIPIMFSNIFPIMFSNMIHNISCIMLYSMFAIILFNITHNMIVFSTAPRGRGVVLSYCFRIVVFRFEVPEVLPSKYFSFTT